MRRTITGFSHPTVKFLRSLREKKHRKQERRFLAEGLRLLTEARDAGRLPEILVMATTRQAHALLDALEADVGAAGGEILEMDEAILAKVTGKDNPQSVCGVFAEFETSLAVIDRSAAPIWLVAQAMRDPGNLGTLLRTGDAVGAGGLILLDDCADPFSVEAVRASMGAIFTQQVATARWEDFLPWLRSGAGQLVGTSLNTDTDYLEATYVQPCFLLIGNESHGLPADYEAACDMLVKIPMAGRADSLNAAVAAAVMAYQVKASWRT